MPEGDTVAAAARRVDRALGGKTLVRSEFRVPRYATVDLVGSRVDEAVSYGKHLLIRIGPVTVHAHLKMEGIVVAGKPGDRWRRAAHLARLILAAEGSEVVGFELGTLDVLARENEHRVIGHLGPDVLGERWNPTVAVENLMREPSRSVAVALLDQRNLAGIGNEYVNELCFLRGLDPRTPIAAVGESGVRAIVELAHSLMEANRDRLVRTSTGRTARGSTTWVYGRAGHVCRRCGTPIRRFELAEVAGRERVTFVCPRCQPAVTGRSTSVDAMDTEANGTR